MSVIDNLTRQAGRLAADAQSSLRRARLEGERRVLQRQHRAALEALGSRAFELIRDGRIPDAELGPEVANVESKLMEIDAKSTEIEALRSDAGPEPGEWTGDAGPGWDAAERYFGRS